MTGYLAAFVMSIFILLLCFGAATYARYRSLCSRERSDRWQWLAASVIVSALGVGFAALKLAGHVNLPLTAWLGGLLLYAVLSLWVATMVYRIRSLDIAPS